jgi:hypothetical protein
MYPFLVLLAQSHKPKKWAEGGRYESTFEHRKEIEASECEFEVSTTTTKWNVRDTDG